jgi:chloramphenicol 3-O phosphotransferase
MTRKPIQIIYLIGPSSSGKTTLAKALQQAFEQPFLHVGVDKIIGWMPEKTNDWTGGESRAGYSWKEKRDPSGEIMQELQVGPFGRKITQTFRAVISTLAEMGHCLIIDDVPFEKGQVDQWKALLKDYAVLWVGVNAPLSILEEREKGRGNRMIGSARAQFYLHKETRYDLEIDTHHGSLEAAVKQIQALAFCAKEPPPHHVSRLGVYGVVIRDGTILLVPKDRGPYLGRYDLPGGKIEFGEGIEEALHREFIEEVGMDFESMTLLDNFSVCVHFNLENQTYRFHHIGLIYSVSGLKSGALSSADLQYKWAELPSLSQETVCPFVWEVIKQKGCVA